jgi:hypothetical protein
MKQISRLSLLFAISLASCATRYEAVDPTLTWSEQEVIEAMLSQEIDAKLSKKQVIENTTSVKRLHFPSNYKSFASELRKQAKRRGPTISESVDDFLQKNQTAVPIVLGTNAPKDAQLVSTNVIAQIFSAKPNAKPNGWDLFYQQFPNSSGLITLSRVGIDSKNTVAIVYMGKQELYLAGSGSIRVLKREGKKWVLTREMIGPMWDS